MKTIDIILIVALSLWVVFSIAYVVVNRKKERRRAAQKFTATAIARLATKRKKKNSNEFSRFPRFFRGNFLFFIVFYICLVILTIKLYKKAIL